MLSSTRKHANDVLTNAHADAYTYGRTYGLTKKVSIRRIPLPLSDRARAHTTILIDSAHVRNTRPEKEDRMTTIRAAVEALHASREALTEGERVEHWWAGCTADHWWVNAGSSSVANAGLGDTAEAAARHIALVASPHVVEALEQLLEQIGDGLHLHPGVMAAADALADAITRETP